MGEKLFYHLLFLPYKYLLINPNSPTYFHPENRTHIQQRNQLAIFPAYVTTELFAPNRQSGEQLFYHNSGSNLPCSFLFRHKNT